MEEGNIGITRSEIWSNKHGCGVGIGRNFGGVTESVKMYRL
jgi:hypothetical protein